MSESKLSGKTIKMIKHLGGDIESHEDGRDSGIPDKSYGLNGINGWMELKYVSKWPKRMGATLVVSNFKSSQKNWLARRGLRGGFCFLLIQVSNYYILVNWDKVDNIGTYSKSELLKNSVCYSIGDLDYPLFKHCLITPKLLHTPLRSYHNPD